MADGGGLQVGRLGEAEGWRGGETERRETQERQKARQRATRVNATKATSSIHNQ